MRHNYRNMLVRIIWVLLLCLLISVGDAPGSIAGSCQCPAGDCASQCKFRCAYCVNQRSVHLSERGDHPRRSMSDRACAVTADSIFSICPITDSSAISLKANCPLGETAESRMLAATCSCCSQQEPHVYTSKLLWLPVTPASRSMPERHMIITSADVHWVSQPDKRYSPPG
jgi:hypothetical protein